MNQMGCLQTQHPKQIKGDWPTEEIYLDFVFELSETAFVFFPNSSSSFYVELIGLYEAFEARSIPIIVRSENPDRDFLKSANLF
jgi:hypothetical protein